MKITILTNNINIYVFLNLIHSDHLLALGRLPKLYV